MSNGKTKIYNPQQNSLKWLKQIWRLAKPYWLSNDKGIAIILFMSVLLTNFISIYLIVRLNKWHSSFYDSIQQYDLKHFISLIKIFMILAAIYIVTKTINFYLSRILTLRWRKWLTNYYLDMWLRNKAYYKEQFLTNKVDNPDQRISEDVNSFVTLFLELFFGIVNSFVTLISFIVILWNLSGSLKLYLFNHNIHLSGYLVWVSLAYAFIGTYLTFKIGRPLIKLDYLQQTREADFRFNLLKIREYSESIAFYHGEQIEKDKLNRNFNKIALNFLALSMREVKIGLFVNSYKQIAIIFPFLALATRYFSKTISLGVLLQTSQAFSSVNDSLSYLITAYTSLSGFKAVMDRLLDLESNLQQVTVLPSLNKKALNNNQDEVIQIVNLSVILPTQLVTSNISVALKDGERLLITGKNGSGKTTLLKTLAGLWDQIKVGNIHIGHDKKTLFIPQKLYLPYGKLIDAICYPLKPSMISKNEVINCLKLLALEHLIDKLALDKDWMKVLSPGEQQQLAFCRILINKPDIVFLDEATSALPQEMEEKLYTTIISVMPKLVIISVAHRLSLKKLHTQEIRINSLSLN